MRGRGAEPMAVSRPELAARSANPSLTATSILAFLEAPNSLLGSLTRPVLGPENTIR
jgi:hypothetical protein